MFGCDQTAIARYCLTMRARKRSWQETSEPINGRRLTRRDQQRASESLSSQIVSLVYN